MQNFLFDLYAAHARPFITIMQQLRTIQKVNMTFSEVTPTIIESWVKAWRPLVFIHKYYVYHELQIFGNVQ